MAKFIDHAGQRFGQWTVLGLAPRPATATSRKGGRYWLCRCSCGAERAVYGSGLRTGKSTGCGCLHLLKAKRTAAKHGRAFAAPLSVGGKPWSDSRKQRQASQIRSDKVKVSLAPVRWPEERD